MELIWPTHLSLEGTVAPPPAGMDSDRQKLESCQFHAEVWLRQW